MPAGTVLGALYSELMDEDDANLAPFPYRRGVQTPNGIGRLALQAQDSTIMQSGLGQDGFVSNAYFVKQHCLDPNGVFKWVQLTNGVDVLWAVVYETARPLEAGEVLMRNYDEISGNIVNTGSKDNIGRHVPVLSGARGEAMATRFPDDTMPCDCHSERDTVFVNEML